MSTDSPAVSSSSDAKAKNQLGPPRNTAAVSSSDTKARNRFQNSGIPESSVAASASSSDSLINPYGYGYDWARDKRNKNRFSDDGTTSWFWRAHTLTVLAFLLCMLVYVALVEEPTENSEYNAKRGLIACVSVFILLGVTITPDGPFYRPHPAFWRLVFCISIVYEMALIFVLFQTATDARLLLKHIDPKLGTALEEKSYGGNCLLYDPGVPNDPFHNIWDKFDLFVPMHFFGWWLKTLVLRDYWLCTVISIMFEILEYTLEHQLPNFSECWWDHWILDATLCNGLGICLGMLTLKYFKVRTYHWRGLWNIPGYKGKFKRILAQFGPHSWIEFDWKPTSTLGRWMSVLAITFVFLLAELNTFYLKFVLWVPPGHSLNLIRLFAFLFWGAVGLRETFQYLDDSECKTFGRQAWVIVSIVSTEFLIVAKFDFATITKPLPSHIALFWLIGIVCLAGWTIWNFGLLKRLLWGSDNDSVVDGTLSSLPSPKSTSTPNKKFMTPTSTSTKMPNKKDKTI